MPHFARDLSRQKPIPVSWKVWGGDRVEVARSGVSDTPPKDGTAAGRTDNWNFNTIGLSGRLLHGSRDQDERVSASTSQRYAAATATKTNGKGVANRMSRHFNRVAARALYYPGLVRFGPDLLPRLGRVG
jgi:hypothetical protein